ncbi:MAG: alpha/beta fold hydrolase, partial [Parcubacteria group bacterium]
SEAPVPDHGRAEWFGGAVGATPRAASFFPRTQPRGTVVLSGGRTEPIEKYFETIQELLDRDFAVLTHDWRGQGLSHRALPDRLKGHARGFYDFLGDYEVLLDIFEARMPKPWIALSHSMGGCLTLLALAHGEKRFSAAILSAPMLGLNTGKRGKTGARALAWLMSRLQPDGYVLGDPGQPFGVPFEANVLTHDRRRYERNNAQLAAENNLALGSPTWSWLDFAFRAIAYLKTSPDVTKIEIPVWALGAEHERLVDNKGQIAVIARVPQGRWLEVPGSYHEILQETDEVRAFFWREFDALAAQVTSRSA